MFRKTLSLSETEIKLDADRGVFEGYASVFGGVDSYGDTIIRGAYDYTLRTNGKPKMLFNHDLMSLPIGKFTSAKEDDKGLFVEGELTAGNSQSEDVRAALKHGTVDGLSIGYWLKKGDYDETEKGRVIRRIHRLTEVSIVAFPADEAARVDLSSVKNEEIDGLESIKDLERFLRDVGGLSNGLAKAITARAKVILGAREAHEETNAKAMQELKAMFDRIAGHIALR